MGDPTYTTGLDLGQASDFSALAVVEAGPVPKGGRPSLAVRHLHRWQLGTPYPAIVADVGRMFDRPPLRGSALVIDRTGVGRAVCDLFGPKQVAAVVKPYTITAGFTAGKRTVPKKDLVAAVQAALGTGRLRFAEGLPLTDTLVKELQTFRVTVTSDRNETFAAWRERDHDDLVLALALAVWHAERGSLVLSVGSFPTPILTPRAGLLGRGGLPMLDATDFG
jgi:hypothetical protein